MSTRQVIEKKERSMAELLIIIVLIGIMAMVFINSFFKQETNISSAAFDALANTFSSKVQIVHGQWMMDKQPDVVELASLPEQDIERVRVNKQGWIDDTSINNACKNIWQMATNAPLMFMNQVVSVVEVARAGQQGRVCRYMVYQGDLQLTFEYSSASGKVTR